ncbi:hypothetical protein [Palaeococcus ferrophilus]|uniref:hypothetical protein n=1 Tax=Palaeococcus ferrophilus TaxID=83868 RepID=UPI00064EE0A4|nr:hypothetical protein [Palaeococcus ferrophilus]
MKRKDFLKLAALLLAVGFITSTYAWWECRNNERALLVMVYSDGLKDARGLSDAGVTFEYLLKENASDNLILTYAHTYSVRAEHLKDTVGALYAVTKDEKFYPAFSAMSNVHLFFQILSFSNSTERSALIENNLETLRELDALFKALATYQYPDDLPKELTEELFKKSEELLEP